MAGLSDWQSNSSDGTLPNTEAVGMFQYRHYINWDTIAGASAGLGRTGKGSWHIQIINAGGVVLFEQKVTISITVIFAGFAIIWYYYDTVGEKIETSIVGGVTIADGSGWTYTIGSTPASETGNMVPGGGTEPAYNGEGIISAFWESPVYKMSVPVGAKLHVITDNWGLGVQVRPEWQWRFGGGVSGYIDSTFDDFGFLYSVNESESPGNLACLLSLPRHEVREQESIVEGATPSIAVERTGRTLMLRNDDGKWNLYESLDAMLSWQKSADEVLQGSVEMAHLVPLTGGGYVMITKNGSNFQYAGRAADGSVLKGDLQVADDTTEISASQNKAGLIYVINQLGKKIAVSSDNGVTFIPT